MDDGIFKQNKSTISSRDNQPHCTVAIPLSRVEIGLSRESQKSDTAAQRHQSPNWKLIEQVKNTSDLDTNEKISHLTSLYGSLSDKDVTLPLISEAQNYHVGTSSRSSIADLIQTKRRMRRLGAAILTGKNLNLADREFGKAFRTRYRRLTPNESHYQIRSYGQTLYSNPVTDHRLKGCST